MDVRVPFEISAKGMKDTNNPGSEVFRFIDVEKHAEDNIPDRGKKQVEKRAIFKEERPKFLRDSKNTMPVSTGNEFTGHMERAELIIFVTTGRTETAFATKRDEFKPAAGRAAIHETAKGGVSAMNHLVNIFNDRRAGMKFI